MNDKIYSNRISSCEKENNSEFINHLTPKEKAAEIFGKYHEFEFTEFVNDKDAAKQCAIIAVDDIIKSGPMHPVKNTNYELWSDRMDEAILYWVEVKKEIEKL